MIRRIFAEAACDWYLVTKGMWRGETKITFSDRKGVYLVVAGFILPATKEFHRSLRIVRVFYCRKDVLPRFCSGLLPLPCKAVVPGTCGHAYGWCENCLLAGRDRHDGMPYHHESEEI